MKHTPTKKQFQTVIDNFKKVLPQAKKAGHLNMMETNVNMYDHKCGTVHCIGGWYAIATYDASKKDLTWTDGTRKMAMDLGFSTAHELTSWAVRNTKLWGNSQGERMFTSTTAWGDTNTLKGVVEFLEAVQKRLPE